MQHGSGDYAASGGPAGHYYPHQYAPPGSNPYPAATDAPAPGAGAGGYASAPPYSVGGGYADQPPYSVGGGYSDQPPSAPAYSQPPPTQPQYGAGYPPYNTNPAPYPPEPYYTYTPPPTQPAAPPAAEPPPLPYDAPYYGGGYQPPAAGYDNEDYLNEGAYAYSGGGGGSEPYGARGTAPARSGSALFDDYGRSISVPSGREEQPWSSGGGGGGSRGGSFGAIARALPKADTHEDSSGGAQKFRVKLLPEGAGNPTDVLCQIGLDGIRMLDPNTSRTLRIYPLDSLTTWEVLDSTIFAFWAKTSVDIEAKRIRLKSSSYTSNTMLDTVTAATVQVLRQHYFSLSLIISGLM